MAKYFSELIDRLKRCVKERSLSPLWGETWDPTAWENEVRNFVLYYPLFTTTDGVPEDLKKRFQSAHASGLPVWWNCSMHTKQYLEALDALILRGREIVAGLEKLKSSSQLVRATLENAVRFRDQLLNEVHGSGMRIAPLGVFLYGPAGTWKTNMADTLAKVIAEDNDLDTTSAGTYEWRKGVNFQDGLTHR